MKKIFFPLFALVLLFFSITVGYSQVIRQYKFTTGEATPGMVLKAVETTTDNTILTITYDMQPIEGDSKYFTINKKTTLTSALGAVQYKIIKSDFVPLCPKKFDNDFKDKRITFQLIFPLLEDKAGKEFVLEEKEGCSGKKSDGFKISGIKLEGFTEAIDAEYYISNPDKIVKNKKLHQPAFLMAVSKILNSCTNNDYKEVTGQLKIGNDQVGKFFCKVQMPRSNPQNNLIVDYGGGKKEYFGAFITMKDSSVDGAVFLLDSLKSLLQPLLNSGYYLNEPETNTYEKIYIFVKKDDNRAGDGTSEQTQFPNITLSLLKNKHNVGIMIGNMVFGDRKE